ncbi:autophagy-related protein 17 [Podospora fimiseda]|uniref:Autophagy-related protein 17 n=1 Tax=Podospora fimiseda TaxID=252190 RepID=A0AAN6YPR7_9PEZI|nr:autophagy-related protein 17 [Podospora fimiseda]
MATTSSSPSLDDSQHDAAAPEFNADDVPVEVLVKHLLDAKTALASWQLVMRANDLATEGRRMHEESVILTAQTGFLRQGIADQISILKQVRRSMQRVYKGGQKDFKMIVKSLDEADARLNDTMQKLRETVVERVFRPPEEEPKSLMDFVDEKSVEEIHNALKESIRELQNAQTSFDTDLLRFDNDLRTLEKILKSTTSNSPSAASSSELPYKPMPHLLAILTNHSHDMAQHLQSLNKHFDMCVTAVRSTQGGAALARRRAADITQDDGHPLSISNDITEQESHLTGGDFEPLMDPQERAEVVQVVVQDASEVDEVVTELHAVLQQMEIAFSSLKEQADILRAQYVSTVNGFQVLEDIGGKLQSYIEAEDEFVDRWETERQTIFETMARMDEAKETYEGYSAAYHTLLMELERRKSVEEKIQSTLRKAKQTVDGILEVDRKEREHFTQEIGDYLPADLWVGMNEGLPRWEFVAVLDEQERMEQEPRTPTLKNVGLATGN